LNSIKVNGRENSEILHAIREQIQRSPGVLTPETATESCPCSQNFMRQSITARCIVIPWDLCAVPAKISRKGIWRPMNFIPFEVFSMGVLVNAMVSPFLN
jgi:hypothetical protein